MSDPGAVRRALVTGGSRGIGAAICRSLARDGWQVLLGYHRSEAAAQALAHELGCRALCADVSDSASAEALVRAAGEIELLVCCAGVSLPEQIQYVSDEAWRKVFAVNTDGAFYCVRAAAPGMIRRRRGSILLISSVCGVYGSSCEAAYAASKGALNSLCLSLFKELGPSGIRVNAIAPGFIDTDMAACYGPGDKAAIAADTPLGRLGKPEDVAELAAFLASDRAGFITGQIIGCDGGFRV